MIKNSMSRHTLSIIRKLGLALIPCIILIVVAWRMLGTFDDRWNLEDIEKYLNVSIPQDAQAVEYTSGTNRYVYVEVSFKASPESTLGFAKNFCNDILYKGYDPFNAIDVATQVPRSVKIDVADPATYTYSYYSYSPRTPTTKSGIFCDIRDGMYWVLVDESEPLLYAIKFKHIGDRFRRYVDVKPIENFPIIVRGLKPELEGMYSTRQFCLDFDPDVVTNMDGQWRALLGADIGISIDSTAMTGAYVSADGRLMRKDDKATYSDPDSELFKYCLIVWQGGWHTLTIHPPPRLSSDALYFRFFSEQTSESCRERGADDNCH